MPVPAGQLVDLVLRRVRDPWGIATTRAFLREDCLTHAQRIVNLASPSVLDVAAMPTHRTRVLYDLPVVGLTRGGAPVDPRDVMRVDAVRDDEGADLVKVDWHSLGQGERGWIRTTASRHRLWSRIGRDLLALFPARDLDGTVTLVYVARTDALTSDDMTTQVRDDRLPAVLALTESLVLMHRRLYPAALSAFQTFETQIAKLPVAGGVGQATFAVGGT